MSTRRRGFVALLAICFVVLCLPCRGAESKKQPSSKSEVKGMTSEMDPCGQPRQWVKGPRFYVWYEKGAWHIRTHTVSQQHTFEGKIMLRGGKVTRVFDYAGMEARAKKKKNRDVGRILDNGRAIGFKMETKGKEDGFSFCLSKAVAAVTFDFRFDGYAHAEVICVGAKCQRPPSATFTLPANPEKPIKKQEKK
jgi:hypothetical protein